ncbi:MAG: single-stranded DNA-binding protein [Legionellales bacterium]|nr:single-stranded DNA-binding protein [Legionellales bacterium]
MSIKTINEVRIRGYLGSAPQVKSPEGKSPYGVLSIATHVYWKQADGQSGQRTDWHTVYVFNRNVAYLSQLKKGDAIDVLAKIGAREVKSSQEESARVVPTLIARDFVKLSPWDELDESTDSSLHNPTESLKEALNSHFDV